MNHQELYALQKDMNRLFISGSKNAKTDDRLYAQLQFLRKEASGTPAGEKLADDIAFLLSSPVSQKIAEKALEISVYLQTLFYEYSDTVLTDKEEEKQPQVPVLNINRIRTNFSYLDLKPAMDALILHIPYRLKILEEAFHKNIFNDIRLQPYLDKAKEDKLPEIRKYVCEVIIPSIQLPYKKNNANSKREI
jgi:hypothetical protein